MRNAPTQTLVVDRQQPMSSFDKSQNEAEEEKEEEEGDSEEDKRRLEQ